MSNSPNFSFPLMTPTQAGKEITYNQFVLAIDALLKAAGIDGSASSLTLAELQSLFLSQAQLGALVAAELAKLPNPLTLAELNTALAGVSSGITLAQLQAELAKLPTSSGGCLTLAQLQTELANLPASQGGGITLAQLQAELNARPVPATVADIQAAVSGISSGGGSGGITLAQLQAEIAKLTPAAFASNYTKLGVLNNTQTGVDAGAYPSVVYSHATGKFYGMDNARGFFEYDLGTQTMTTLNVPLSPAGYKTIAPSLSVMPSGKVLWTGANQNSNATSKACYTFDPAASSNKWSLRFNSALTQFGAVSFPSGLGTLIIGGSPGLSAQIYNESTGLFTFLDSVAFPHSYTVDGISYSGVSGLKGCALPSGKGLVVIPVNNAYGNACTALKMVLTEYPNDGWPFVTTTATPTAQRFPANSSCMAIAGTSYGAVALVRAGNAGLTRFYKYSEAADSWTPMSEGFGFLSVSNAVAMACGPDDQVLVVTESGSNPGLYLLNAAA